MQTSLPPPALCPRAGVLRPEARRVKGAPKLPARGFDPSGPRLCALPEALLHGGASPIQEREREATQRAPSGCQTQRRGRPLQEQV